MKTVMPFRWWTNYLKEQECNFCISTKTTDREGSYVREVISITLKNNDSICHAYHHVFWKKIKEIVSDSDFKTIHLPVLFGKKDTIFKPDSEVKGYKTKDKADASAKENWLVLQIKRRFWGNDHSLRCSKKCAWWWILKDNCGILHWELYQLIKSTC